MIVANEVGRLEVTLMQTESEACQTKDAAEQV